MKSNILKSIFVTILLLLGASHAANAAITGNIYFDNTSTNWSTVYCFLGHNGYLKSYAMTLDHDGIWKTTQSFNNEWGDATGIYFASSDGGVSGGTKSKNINSSRSSDLGLTLYTAKSTNISAGTSNCYVPQSSSNNASLSNNMSVEEAIAAHGGTGEVTNTDLIEVLKGTKVMFYYGDTWGSGTKYLRTGNSSGEVDKGTSSKATFTNSSNNKTGELHYRTVCVASAKYYISNSSDWAGVQMSNAAQGGYAYALTNANTFRSSNSSNHIDELPSMSGVTFASNSYNVNEGTANSGISATKAHDKSVAGKTNTIKYYYTKDNSTYYTFNPSDVSSLAAGEYTIIAVAYDGSIYVKGGSATLTVYPSTPCTAPTIAWTTAPADGTVGGNMTATVSTNQTSPTVTWTSSNTSVATIDANGKITYKAAGTTTITASYTGNGTTYCAVEASVSKEITVTEAHNSPKNYYYYDSKGDWNDANCVEFTKETEYAYATLTGYKQNNEFKIFDGNTKSTEKWFENGKDNEHTVACAPHIDNSLGNIALVKAGEGDYANAKFSAASIATNTFYVILYYPNTTLNNTSNYKLCASTTLPGGVAPAQNWYVYGVGGELSWDKNGGKKMTLHGEGYYYYTCSGVSQFKIDGSTLTDAALGDTYKNNSFPDAATANITLDGSGEPFHNINVTDATGEFEIRLYPAGEAGNETGNPIIIAHRDVIATGTFWYFDAMNTGWKNTIADKWKFVDAGDYAYVSVPARNSEDNYFKIFPDNPKDDKKVTANGDNIADGDLAGEIKLESAGLPYKDIKIAATTADYYVILYYPRTSTNSKNGYLVAATYDLPGMQKYAVSFGVVGNTGGTITAKSGSSTITLGQLVSRATFTATPAPGYAIAGWYKDAEGTQKIADASTTYSQAITASDNTVYVKFEKKYAIYFKPNNVGEQSDQWENAWAYIFGTTNVWDQENNKGVSVKGNTNNPNYTEYGQMGKLNDSVFYYNLQSPTDQNIKFALNNADQHTYDFFYSNCYAIYRSDFQKDMPVFIAQKGQNAEIKNENQYENKRAYYYNKGVWMKFNDTVPGYNLCLKQGESLNDSYRFTAAKAGDYISTVDVELTKDVTYNFWVKNDKQYNFKTEAGTCNENIHQFTFYHNNGQNNSITITPAITGTYTFQLNLANGKVEIDVLYPTTQYRLVYVEKEKDGNQNIVKFHPSHIIKKRAGGTEQAPLYDTISMHVRPKMLNNKDTVANTNTCEVWLQKFQKKQDGNSMDWKTIQTIDTKDCSAIKTNGVYNFILRQSGSEATIEPTAIHPYTGRYYIRTDASDGGWNNYKQLSNYFYYTEYSRVYRGFDHYYCRWAQKTNLKYTIACDYSYCVSDTLAQEGHAPHSTYTDVHGTLNCDANVRFMWNSFDNTLDRAYLAGAGQNLHLLSEGGIFNSEGAEEKDLVLSDQQNWVYRADVQAKTNTRIKLRATPYNDTQDYAWFRGKGGTGNENFSEANSEILIAGSGEAKYPIRIIYDFKTDHLICAWVPKDTTIQGETMINTDLMIIRKENEKAAQLKFKPEESKLSSVTTAFCVITLTKELLGNTELTPQQRGIFYVSFPFDVRLADVFGCGKYGVDYVLGYYDGATRAREGWWSNSGTFWCYVWNPTNFVLEKGVGYILALDYDKIVREQFQHDNKEVNIYFPSYNTAPMDITGELTKVVVPEHKCTIQRQNRDIYDSNWNLIGVPSWANVDEFGIPQPVQNNQTRFLYNYDAGTDTWTASEATKTTFQSMYAYMVQWAGTINWQATPPILTQSALQARRNAPAAEGDEEATAIEQYTFRLTLNRGEQQLDHTYIRLQEGNVTTDFDLNYDMTKIVNSGANLYSLVGTQQIQCAANVQPLQEEAQTISIPLGVVADQDGLYTFSLPDGTEGMNVSIADSESGTVHNLSLGDYQTALTAGTHEGRFALEIQPRQEVSTGCEQTDAAGKRLRKVLINANLYILRDGKAYTATGNEL